MPQASPSHLRPTLFDVCRSTGLSTATVSRAINGHPKVSPSAREKIMQAVKELGYAPSHAARSLAGRGSQTVGVVFPRIDHGFFTDVLRGIDEIAIEHAYHLAVAFAHGTDDEQKLIESFIRERRVESLILMNLHLPDDFVQKAARSGLPLVLIDKHVPGSGLFAVTIDNANGTRRAMEHLLDHGYRRIAILTGPDDTVDGRERLATCRRVAGERNAPLSPELIWTGDFTEQCGRETVERWLAENRPLPEAIFALNDAMALGAMDVLDDHGIRVPQDVAVVGFDDEQPARHQKLTTVRVPMRQIGRAAAEAAIRGVRGGTIDADAARTVVPTELIVRRSCGCNLPRARVH